MTSRTVSVIIPAFNAEPSLTAAVHSALDQGVDGIEILVIDDGSTDATASMLQRFAAAQTVRVLRHPDGINRGVCASRRLGLSEARGEFVAFLDADDAYLPGKLTHSIAQLRAHPAVVLAHGRTISTGLVRPGACGPADGFSMGEAVKIYRLSESPGFLDTNPICNSTVVCRRSALQISDLPEEMIFQFEDWVLFCVLAQRGPFLYDPKPLTQYAGHEGSFSHRHFRRSGAWEIAHLEYLLVMMSRMPNVGLRRQAGRMITDSLVRLAQIRGNSSTTAATTVRPDLEPWVASLVLRSLTPAVLMRLLGWTVRQSAPGRWLRRYQARITSKGTGKP